MKRIFLAATFIIASAVSFSQTKIAVVDTRKLMDTLPKRKQIMVDYEHLSKSLEQDLTDQRGEVEKMIANYKLHPEWSESIKQYESERIQNKQQELEYAAQDADQKLNAFSSQKQQELFIDVQAAVQLIAEKKGYDVILDVNNTVFSKAPDLTNEVAAYLLVKK